MVDLDSALAWINDEVRNFDDVCHEMTDERTFEEQENEHNFWCEFFRLLINEIEQEVTR